MDATTIGIIAVITSIGSLLVIFGKTIKNSTCLGCLKCETRTPPPSITITPAPTPHQTPELEKKKITTIAEYNV